MFECKDQFCDIKLGTVLCESRLSLQVPKEFASRLEIGNEIEILLGLKTEFQPDQERRFQGDGENLALPNSMRNLFFCNDFLLGQDFHGINPLRVLLSDLENFTEGASADEFQELEGSRRKGMFCLTAV
jgi:hypothetical protein